MSLVAIDVEASKLKANPKISLRINELREETKELREESLAEVLNEVSSWIQFDPIEMFNEDDTLKNIRELPKRVRKSIVSFEVVELFESIDRKKVKVGELKKVKLVDKKGAAEMQLKKLGAFITNVNLKTDDLEHLTDLLKGIEE